MTLLFRHDLSDLARLVPQVIDARCQGTWPAGALPWVQSEARPEGTRWISPLFDPGADGVLLRAGMSVPEGETRPLWCGSPDVVPDHHPGPVVLTRLACYPCDADGLLAALDAMDRDPRLLLETSGASIAHFVTIAAERHPERVLFASGGPIFDPEAQLAHVAAALTDDGVLARVLHDNAAERLGDARC